MERASDTLYLKLALVVALASAAMLAGIFGPAATEAHAAPAPRITLSVPAEVTQAVSVSAKGRITPSLPGRILLQARAVHAWRALAAGKVRQGKFKISFVLKQANPSELQIRAKLVQGGRSLAISAVRKVSIRPAQAAPEPTPSTAGKPSAAAASLVASSQAPPTAEEPPVPLPPPGNAYWGAWIGSQLTGTAAPWDMSAVSKFEGKTGKAVSLLEFSSPWADCSRSPCSYYTFPWDPFNAVRAHGAIPFFSWGSQMIPGTPTQPEFQLADIIAGHHDTYIRSWATAAASWGHPFFLRFDWEMNGEWFPWGEAINGNQPGEFATAWQHVHKIFNEVGASNATWVWCPYVNHLNLYASLYPGDAYVDWTCLDGYNWGENPAAPYGWRTFNSIYEKAYAKVTEQIAPTKPMVIGEIASSEYGPTGTSKAGWIEEMFEGLATRYPKISALVWFETLSNGEDWPLESSASAEDAFAAGISDSRFLANVFGGISASPIPAP
jgi:hypothetical protein